MNKDSIEFSLSTWTWSGFKLSWLKSYTRTRSYHFQALFALNPIYFYSHHWLTLNRWSSQSLVTSIHSQALGLRGLCSQLGTAVKYGTEQVRMGWSWVELLRNRGILLGVDSTVEDRLKLMDRIRKLVWYSTEVDLLQPTSTYTTR